MAEPYLQIVTSLPHRLRVMRLYRYGLRELLNWSSNRHEWFPRAQALRLEFEGNKGLVSSHAACRLAGGGCRLARHTQPRLCRVWAQTDREDIRKQVELGEELISRFRHWEPVLRESWVLQSERAVGAGAAAAMACSDSPGRDSIVEEGTQLRRVFPSRAHPCQVGRHSCSGVPFHHVAARGPGRGR